MARLNLKNTEGMNLESGHAAMTKRHGQQWRLVSREEPLLSLHMPPI